MADPEPTDTEWLAFTAAVVAAVGAYARNEQSESHLLDQLRGLGTVERVFSDFHVFDRADRKHRLSVELTGEGAPKVRTIVQESLPTTDAQKKIVEAIRVALLDAGHRMSMVRAAAEDATRKEIFASARLDYEKALQLLGQLKTEGVEHPGLQMFIEATEAVARGQIEMIDAGPVVVGKTAN